MCAACVGHVEKALRSVPGVRTAKADLAAGRAVVGHEDFTDPSASSDALVAAVAEEGYTAQRV